MEKEKSKKSKLLSFIGIYILIAFLIPYFLLFYVGLFKDSFFLLFYFFIGLPITFVIYLILLRSRFKGIIKKYKAVFYLSIAFFIAFYVIFGLYIYWYK